MNFLIINQFNFYLILLFLVQMEEQRFISKAKETINESLKVAKSEMK